MEVSAYNEGPGRSQYKRGKYNANESDSCRCLSGYMTRHGIMQGGYTVRKVSEYQASLDKPFKTSTYLVLLLTTPVSCLFTTKSFKIKVNLPLLAIFAGFAAAKLPGDATANQLDNNGVDTNTIDDSSLTGPNYCPVGKTCSSDKECGLCSCNNRTNKCQE
ncbi:hypothetical protein MAC_07523 [Metarhizium acridum CQMa 102]|uniref:Uncharacterized protein n=1 Tax=Metarhizium acridum (strain CQMa 102) TaxID=655827 RepID=E9ECC5_METAQ|nr:uncharacterized protein MAC_07523 [Metarhizium acridum CQMa 102]EFY86445.1 hypothetical protein MAC_07523 [Metarhizium acridum CQMa 102]